MLCAALAKGTAANVPSAKGAGKNHLHGVWALTFLMIEAGGETKLAAGATQQPVGRLGQQSFACPIHQSQALLTIKCEDCHINFRHHGTQQGGCFESSNSLL